MRRLLLTMLVLGCVCAARPAQAQQPTPTKPTPARPAPTRPAPARDTTTAQTPDTTRKGISPGKAFLRSVLIPGWGQFSAGAPRRGVVFIALQSSSWYMLVKTLNKVSEAENFEKAHRAAAVDTTTASLQALAQNGDTMLTRQLADPDTFKLVLNNALDTVSTVRSARALVDSRHEQRQDWITYTLFLTLASGVDAFVAAHLADFPVGISTNRQRNGAFQVKLTVPIPRKP